MGSRETAKFITPSHHRKAKEWIKLHAQLYLKKESEKKNKKHLYWIAWT